MNKVTVSKEQMEEVMKYKGTRGLPLNDMLYHASNKNFGGGSKIINDMTPEQTKFIWHGHAKKNNKLVIFDEVMEYFAEDKNKSILYKRGVSMNKITVSKQQMEAVNLIKRDKLYSLEELINTLVEDGLLIFSNDRSGINDMSTEQIVLAWHGHIEVSPEYVSFDEAMKAYDKGHLVSFHPKRGSKITVSHQSVLKGNWLGDYSLKGLREGEWSIEGGKQ